VVDIGPEEPAARLVHPLLQQQLADLKVWEPAVRDDQPDAVHQMRVTLRRMRSALATFRPVLACGPSEALREDLQWVGEVLHQRLRELLSTQPAELVLGPVAARIDTELGQMYREAHARAVDAMASARYAAALGAVHGYVVDPPWTSRADDPVGDVTRGRMRHDWRRLRARARAAEEPVDPHVRQERLHEVRKAVKRVRYAAEAMVCVYGDDAARFAKAAKRVQSVLGEYRDSTVTMPVLRRLGVQAHLDGQNGFTYGRLQALEESRATRLEAVYATVLRKASRRTLRLWFT
jgi:CHAD domain-containing protein